MKVAIVYDRANKWGGAERFLLVLREIFPQADLIISLHNPEKAVWTKKFKSVKTSFLNRLFLLRDFHEALALFMPLAFESINLCGYDLVISVSSEAAKGVITPPETKHIAIILTPTRYLWSHLEVYFSQKWMKLVSKPFISYLKKWDLVAANRPDVLIAISNEVRRRIKKYYNRTSLLLYPPQSLVEGIDINAETTTIVGEKDYYLIVSRLVKYKNIDLAIGAFNKLGKKLIIIGKGKDERRLKRYAGENIIFLGEITDAELIKYYREAKALVMPQEEDFGLVSLEAQSLGTPVIAFSFGGAKDTVMKNSGVFFHKLTVDSLFDAVKRFDKMNFRPSLIRNNAKKFNKTDFKKDLLKIIKNV